MRQKARALALLDHGGAPRDGSGGFMAAVGRVAIVVGCLTGIGGLISAAPSILKAAHELFRGAPAKAPRITLTPGGVLVVQWAATTRHLTFTYNVALHNDGDAPDEFESAQAYLLDPMANGATPGVHAALTEITMTESANRVVWPLSVAVGQRRALQLEVVPATVDRSNPFAEAGLYRLVLELQKRRRKEGAPSPEPEASRGTYCFFIGQNVLPQLHAQGKLNVSPYLECES